MVEAAGKDQNVVFSLEKIYLKDVSFEAPAVPRVFIQAETPQVNMQLTIQHAALDREQGLFEVNLVVNVDARSGEKAVFLVELQQAGIFHIAGLEGEALRKALEIGCAYVLLPFAREAVNDLVVKGGFPQLLLSPINFEALYEQKRAASNEPAQQKS